MMDFILTGSRVYGPAKEDSDIDIVMTIAYSTILEAGISALGIAITREEEQIDYGSGYYFKLGEMLINIVGLASEEDLGRWTRATERMRGLPPIENKVKRIEQFNKLCY